jgi:hypothetical protein
MSNKEKYPKIILKQNGTYKIEKNYGSIKINGLKP